MRLLVTTPTAVEVAADDVRHVRAEDETGSFGILPGHADFLTVLPISVVSWHGQDGAEHHAAVRGGVLTVSGGQEVAIATRQAIREDDLEALARKVQERFRLAALDEETTRTAAQRLHLATIRQVQRVLDAGRGAAQPPQRPFPAPDGAGPGDAE